MIRPFFKVPSDTTSPARVGGQESSIRSPWIHGRPSLMISRAVGRLWGLTLLRISSIRSKTDCTSISSSAWPILASHRSGRVVLMSVSTHVCQVSLCRWHSQSGYTTRKLAHSGKSVRNQRQRRRNLICNMLSVSGVKSRKAGHAALLDDGGHRSCNFRRDSCERAFRC